MASRDHRVARAAARAPCRMQPSQRVDRANPGRNDSAAAELAWGTGFAMRLRIELFPELLRNRMLDNRRS